MALTVTSSVSGAGITNGIALSVRVVNNASYTQNGVAASSTTGTLPQLAITPGGSGNWVYGTAGTGATATLYTSLLANTTSIGQVNLSSPSVVGYYRSTSGTTTSSTTYGWGAPTESSGSYYVGCAEIIANGTLGEDASSPAVVSTTSATTVTTASFTPPGAAILVAMVGANWTGSGAVTPALSDSASAYTWSQRPATTEGTVLISTVWVGIPKVLPRITSMLRARTPYGSAGGRSVSGGSFAR